LGVTLLQGILGRDDRGPPVAGQSTSAWTSTPSKVGSPPIGNWYLVYRIVVSGGRDAGNRQSLDSFSTSVADDGGDAGAADADADPSASAVGAGGGTTTTTLAGGASSVELTTALEA